MNSASCQAPDDEIFVRALPGQRQCSAALSSAVPGDRFRAKQQGEKSAAVQRRCSAARDDFHVASSLGAGASSLCRRTRGLRDTPCSPLVLSVPFQASTPRDLRMWSPSPLLLALSLPGSRQPGRGCRTPHRHRDLPPCLPPHPISAAEPRPGSQPWRAHITQASLSGACEPAGS